MLENLSKYEIVLGSQSSRRQTLLKQLGLTFHIQTYPTNESFPNDLKLEKIPEYLAQKKANSIIENVYQKLNFQQLLITSDTVVILGDQILNKPSNQEEAQNMLLSLSGKMHQVISGVCLKTIHQEIIFSEMTKVYFKELSKEEIDFYIHKYQPFDKAGSYGIQEWIGMIGIEKIEGDFYNVMGLPLKKLFEKLKLFS